MEVPEEEEEEEEGSEDREICRDGVEVAEENEHSVLVDTALNLGDGCRRWWRDGEGGEDGCIYVCI